MGTIRISPGAETVVLQGYNVTEVGWTRATDTYICRITLTGIDYDSSKYVTLVTPIIRPMNCYVRSERNQLVIYFVDLNPSRLFSFAVYEVP